MSRLNLYDHFHWVDINSVGVRSEDDRYILEMALGRNTLVISNDKFSDIASEKNRVWKHIIDNRILRFEIRGGEDFCLTEISKNILDFYLTGTFVFEHYEPAREQTRIFCVLGFGIEITEAQVEHYVNIRGVPVRNVVKTICRRYPQIAKIKLTVLKSYAELLKKNSDFWPSGFRCSPWRTW